MQMGSDAAPHTAPATQHDFQSTCSVGSFRKTIGFAGGWGGFNTAQLNLSSQGNLEHTGLSAFIWSWKMTTELKNISGHTPRQLLFC